MPHSLLRFIIRGPRDSTDKQETSRFHDQQTDPEQGGPRTAWSLTPSRPANRKMYDYLAMVGEFIGTFLFLWLAFTGAQSANLYRTNVDGQDNTTILFIALSFGMALTVTCWCFFRVTGAAFNPAVTLSLWFIGGITTFRAILVFFAQMIGGIAAAAISKGLTVQRGPIGFSVVNKTADGVSNGQALGIEMFTTSVLVFSVLMLAAEKHRSTFLAPVCIGLALFIGHLASIGWTGAGMNPARSFGPSVVNGDFPSNAWVYYLGQLLGAFLATLIYALLKHLDYSEIAPNVDTANPAESAVMHNAPITGAMAAARVLPPDMISQQRQQRRSYAISDVNSSENRDMTVTAMEKRPEPADPDHTNGSEVHNTHEHHARSEGDDEDFREVKY